MIGSLNKLMILPCVFLHQSDESNSKSKNKKKDTFDSNIQQIEFTQIIDDHASSPE